MVVKYSIEWSTTIYLILWLDIKVTANFCYTVADVLSFLSFAELSEFLIWK